jgi:hypothetical protein
MDDYVEVPKDVLKGLYRIMCAVPYISKGSFEVYDEAILEMRKAQDWVIKYGKLNNIDTRGWEEHKNKLKK